VRCPFIEEVVLLEEVGAHDSVAGGPVSPVASPTLHFEPVGSEEVIGPRSEMGEGLDR
jgi:hypothetical protein